MLRLYSSLGEKLGMSRKQLQTFAANAPKKYKVYAIPKRTYGHRIIAHPARKLKHVQRHLVTILQAILQPHPAAYAYQKKRSIKDNANCHRYGRYLLKMDFSDFFHSITPELFFAVCDSHNIQWSDAEKELLTLLLFWNRTKTHGGKLVLSIGAPSSPLISNFVMYDFDEQLALRCKNLQINYTRYADDLTFSTRHKDILFDLPSKVDALANQYCFGCITINPIKTKFSSKQHNRHVTGVTITNDNQLSIGRAKKRMISSLIHRLSIGQLDEDQMAYLQGMLAYSLSIEPIFIDRMRKKYSDELINQIFQWRVSDE